MRAARPAGHRLVDRNAPGATRVTTRCARAGGWTRWWTGAERCRAGGRRRHSMSTIGALGPTTSPSLTWTSVTIPPPVGDDLVLDFIASSTATVSPIWTRSPTLTRELEDQPLHRSGEGRAPVRGPAAGPARRRRAPDRSGTEYSDVVRLPIDLHPELSHLVGRLPRRRRRFGLVSRQSAGRVGGGRAGRRCGVLVREPLHRRLPRAKATKSAPKSARVTSASGSARTPSRASSSRPPAGRAPGGRPAGR